MSCTIDCPQGQLYCMGDGDSLPIRGSCLDVTQIWAKLSSGACPASSGNPIEEGASEMGCSGGAWDFGSLSSGDVGVHCLRVWHLDDGDLEIQFNSVEFEIAAAGSPSCYGVSPAARVDQGTHRQRAAVRGSARTRHAAPAAPAARNGAIKQSAPRLIRVSISASGLQLPEPAAWLRASGALQLPPIVLEYCPRSSSVRRAVWTGNGAGPAEVWRLETKRNGSGQLRASLALQRLGASRVLPPLVWSTNRFCFKAGGRLRCTTAQMPVAIVEAAS